MTASSRDALSSLRHRRRAAGMPALCSAHPAVLRAAVSHAARSGAPVLIEATCNQVNHLGGYTGLRPADFARLVHAIADEEGLPRDRVLLGGDHLGPSPWRALDAESAMAQAEEMVASYVAAGFSKVHLDASMGCAGEPDGLDDATTARRAARLAGIAEREARRTGREPPLYIIGTEVPPPGGADHVLTAIAPTSPARARQTIETHRAVFAGAGLEEAFGRAIGLVVQPGVEFGNENVIPYDPARAAALSDVLAREGQFVFEAHSTDYQDRAALRALVADGFAILKVGPELTFAMREALYGLDLIAGDLVADYGERPLYRTMERIMIETPDDWRRHYAGPENRLRLQRHYSFSDRIRYYWTKPAAQAAVGRLMETLAGVSVPVTLFRQHMPRFQRFAGRPLDPGAVVLAAVTRVVEDYRRACDGRVAEDPEPG